MDRRIAGRLSHVSADRRGSAAVSQAVSTSLCALVCAAAAAASGQQLGLQALDLRVFGGQELLQLGDFRLWMKTN